MNKKKSSTRSDSKAATFTPGPQFGAPAPAPWRLDADANLGDWQVIDATGTRVIADRPSSHEAPNGIANARLIAQAPAMYALLKRAVSFEPDDADLIADMKACLAAMEGK